MRFPQPLTKARMFNDYQTIVKHLGDLPPMPAVAIKVLELLRNPYCSAKLLAKAISHDAAVSGRILRIANSPMYGRQKRVTTLEGAVVVLGENILRTLVLETSLRGINKSFGRLERMLWEDSIGCAIGARILARRLGQVDPEEAFIAGLFRHIGKVVMSNHDKETYQRVMETARTANEGLIDVERAFFAFSHELVGAAVLDNWNLSPALVQSALHHHDLRLDDPCDAQVRHQVAMVNIAGQFCRRLGIGQETPMPDLNLTLAPGAVYLGLNSEELEQSLDELASLFEKERDFFLAPAR
ncbi:HDOD domain-containing protein [Geoalkalibacter sp.]|uniref:HDOD domain-containing protein n=1 Tax=Geoalkalibacter sp. TaxID=3041440 RepID=UPI00272E4CBD|nr:HDOD domain-containing protein [Geoalkalibacter sp.]